MRLFRVALVVLTLFGFAGTANAAVIVWTANLDGGQENPPHPTLGTGFGMVTFDDITNVLAISLNWMDLTTTAVQAHIHCCTPPTGNVGIAVDLWLAATPQPPSGSFSSFVVDLDLANPFRAGFVATNGGSVSGAMAALAAAMNVGNAYFNIHTEVFPGGEIRGNISPARLQAPEPATLLLLTLGVGALGGKRLRRRMKG